MYADALIENQSEMIMQLDSFLQSSYYENYDINQYYLKAVRKNKECLMRLDSLNGFKNNGELYKASRRFFIAVEDVLKNEGKEILTIQEKQTFQYSLDLQDKLDIMLKESVRKITLKQLEFDSVLTVFLDQYGYDVEMDTSTVAMEHPDSLKVNK